MSQITLQEKYAQPDVVAYWHKLARQGLQQAEQVMLERYLLEATPADSTHYLDVGCGAGRAVLALKEAGYQTTGLDVSLPLLAAGRSLSPSSRFSAGDLLNLPFAAARFDGLLMLFGALQHLPHPQHRRQALAEMGRITKPGGRLMLGLDNLAPALTCYGYWLGRKLTNKHRQPKHIPAGRTTPADATLWSRRQVHPLLWHGRGLWKTVRWRTWPGWIDRSRRLGLVTGQPGDMQVAQFGLPPTPGYIFYHLYQPAELVSEAAAVGWQLLGYHSGAELIEGQPYPAWVKGLDKQLFFAFRWAG